MNKADFEKLVEEAFAEIHREYKNFLKNLVVIVEDVPTREIYSQMDISQNNLLLGLYHGVPYKHKGPFYGNVAPDVILIFQKPIERICHSDKEIRKKVGEVLRHEIAHYFGKTERELRKMESEGKKQRKG